MSWANDVEAVYVFKWSGRKLTMLTARTGSEHRVLARFVSVEAGELFMALVQRGLMVDVEEDENDERSI